VAALAELGNPQDEVSSILIVGTNGKGSTAAILDAVLAAHGMRTGLYTSPHLVRVEERIRVSGEDLSSADLLRHLERLDPYPELTFFETLTAAALLAFSEAGVQCAVLEAGMGGRWDATRVAGSEIAGLTNVGSDHPMWLGSDREDCAADKGDALAAARFAVVGSQVESELVSHLGAPDARQAGELVQVERCGRGLVHVAWDGCEVDVELPLAGLYQLANLQLALSLARGAEQLGWLERLDQDAVRAAMRRVRWSGRLSVHRVLGRRILVDCAHNAEGATALAGHLADAPVLYHLLFSCLDDKPVETMARALWPQVGNVTVVPLDDERAMPVDRLLKAFPDARCAASVEEGLEQLPSPVVAAGSVRLVGELLRLGDRESLQ
jgi:dihydrofolate synthase/folylpolyglutamate synthase